jgi:thioredoxin reductase (NADPH)
MSVDDDALSITDNAVHDCVVVGAGPAGTLAALYLKRFCRDVAVIDAGRSRTRYISASRNCPGFPYGIGGKELLERLRQQLQGHGVDVIGDRVLRVRHARDGLFCVESDSAALLARSVIVATGVVDRLPRWPNVEAAILANLVRLCAVCDAFEAEDKRIAVYGNAETGIGHASFMRAYSTRVAFIHPPDETLPAEQREEAARMGVEVLQVAEEDCLLTDGAFCVQTSDGVRRNFDCVYVSLGSDAKTTLLEGLGVLTRDGGDVQVDEKCETSVGGIYAIGDAVSALNQISVAFGHAAIAATAVHNRLAPNPRH